MEDRLVKWIRIVGGALALLAAAYLVQAFFFVMG
jgi:hypothetical protein